jgi:hypothetical protein
VRVAGERLSRRTEHRAEDHRQREARRRERRLGRRVEGCRWSGFRYGSLCKPQRPSIVPIHRAQTVDKPFVICSVAHLLLSTVSLSIHVVCSLIASVALIEGRSAGKHILESSILLNHEQPAKYDELSLDRGQAIGPVQYATGSKWGGGNAGSSCNGPRGQSAY